MSNYSLVSSTKKWIHFDQDAELLNVLEQDVLPAYLQHCRWFGGKSSKLESLLFQYIFPVPVKDDRGYLLILKTLFNTGKSDFYLLPLTLVNDITGIDSKGVIANINYNNQSQFLIDGIYDVRLREIIFKRLVNEEDLISGDTKIIFRRSKGMSKKESPHSTSKVLDAEQSNSSIIYNDKYFFKLYRKLFPAINPDVETTSFLTETAHFKYIPPFAGTIYLQTKDEEPITLAMMQMKVDNVKDVWSLTGDYLNKYLFSVQKGTREIGEDIYSLAKLLGTRTAEMHLALASDKNNPAFNPIPFDGEYLLHQTEHYFNLLQRRLKLLDENIIRLDVRGKILSAFFIRNTQPIQNFFLRFKSNTYRTKRIRIHGDYHLGQVLSTGNDVVILDFEGEPESSIHERRVKHSPLKDVAGMLRSFHYAVSAKLFFSVETKELSPEVIEEAAMYWYDEISKSYLNSYYNALKNFINYDQSKEEIEFLLQVHLLEKAIYELGYELNARPDWVKIPLKGIEHAIQLLKKFK